MLKKDLIARGGQIIDATSIQRLCMSHLGYSLSINVDKKYKFICKTETDTASAQDCRHFDNVSYTSNTSRDVYADRGYRSKERSTWLKQNGFRSYIQRKGQRNS